MIRNYVLFKKKKDNSWNLIKQRHRLYVVFPFFCYQTQFWMFFVFVKSFFWTSKLLQLYWKIKNSVFSFSRRLKQISYSHFGYPAKQIRTIQIFTHTDTQTHWQISNHMSEGKLSQFEYRWENTVCLFFPSSVVNKSGRGGEIESNLLNYL